jgi:hypothetical protein
MDLNEITSATGMREFTSNQRDTLINDARELRQIAEIVKNRIAESTLDGDKPGAARRRATKVDKKFQQAIRLLEKAAGVCEAIEGTHRREITELPDRRAKALAKKQQRAEHRALSRQKAHALTRQSLAESAQQFAVDPRLAAQVPPMPATAPQYVNPHPGAYAAPAAERTPLADFADVFEGTG